MALLIWRKVGQSFFVEGEADSRVTVHSIESPQAFTLRRDRDGSLFQLRSGSRAEVLDGLHCFVGDRSQGGAVRIGIEAPFSRRVLRDPL